MIMKGSFWKNNIKKIKKERKERQIAEKVKISRMKTKKTVSNELQFVVTDNEKKQQQKLQELEDISQESVEYCKLLLDSVIIYDMFMAPGAGARLNNYLEKKPLWGNDLLFLTLDRVITEFKNMMKYKFAEEFDYAQICGQLSSLGRFQDDRLDTRAEYAHKAEKLCKSEKYIGSNGVPLSQVDCYLLEYAIEYSCKLVTRDKGLINATKKEIRLRFDESELTGATSPGVFNPKRT